MTLESWRQGWTRYRFPLAVAGAIVTGAQVARWFIMGAWPPHDTATIWLAGLHLRLAEPVYTGTVGQALVFLYSPPIAVLAAPWSLFPVEVLAVALLIAQVLAFRWVVGSWMAVGLVCWLPVVPRELVTGNVDFVMAAAIFAAVRRLRGSGWSAALFTFMKFSPALAVRRWREFAVASAVLVAVTLPWLDLWPAWVSTMVESLGASTDTLPILLRVPVVIALLLLQRPWATAAAAAFATPAFYFHSWVLVFAAARLWIENRRSTMDSGSWTRRDDTR